MDYTTVDQHTPSQLVATILGKKSVDDECHRIADLVMNEDYMIMPTLADHADTGQGVQCHSQEA